MEDELIWWVVSKLGFNKLSTIIWELETIEMLKPFGVGKFERYFSIDEDGRWRRSLLFKTSSEVYENIKKYNNLRVCVTIKGINFLTSKGSD